MTEKKNYQPSNYRIISIRQRRRILHVEDALDIGKIRFDLYAFAQGQGSQARAEAYVDLHTARLLFQELAAGRLHLTHNLQIRGGGKTNGETTARILIPEMADGTDNPIRITITNGPGLKQTNGLITPNQWEKDRSNVTRLQILLSETDAQRVGLAGLEHLQAWATNTYADRLTTGQFQPDPDLDPVAGAVVDALTGEMRDHPSRTSCPTGSQGSATSRSSAGPEGSARYANGQPISANEHERLAFTSYVKTNHQVPAHVDALRKWWQDTHPKTSA
jgi:hypothetical protein